MMHVPEPTTHVSDTDLGDSGTVFDHNPPQPGLRLLHVGNHLVEQRWDQATICNPFWRIYLTDRDGVSLSHQGQHLAYRPDRLMVIPAWCPFIFHADTTVRHAFIHYELVAMPGVLVRRLFPAPRHIDDPNLLIRIRHWARALMARGRVDAALAAEAAGLALLVNATMLRDHDPMISGAPWRCLGEALHLVDERLDRTISVADLARSLNCSPTHCIRLFRRHLGQTPTRYIIERRVTRAAELLLDRHLGLDAIANRCGLGNRHYLSRVFTRHMGIGPAAYRRRHLDIA